MSDGQVEFIPFEDKRLGRHIRHDPQSRAFAVRQPRRLERVDVRHRNFGRKLNQRNVGACTCFTAAHAVNSSPVRQAIRPVRLATPADALEWYRFATRNDPWEGSWEPDDTGSSGLAACKALVNAGRITRYEWAFGYQQGVGALQRTPLMQGTWWTDDMFHPDKDGRVRPTGGDAGGHEYLWVGYEVRSRLSPSQDRSWFLNSWWDPAQPWGKSGYFYMTGDDHDSLLARDGDLIAAIA